MILLARLRSLVLWIIYPVFLIFCSTVCVVMNLIFNQRKIDNAIIRFWSRGTCLMFNVDVEVINKDKIPRDTGFLYVFNHSSFFDIWAMNVGLPSFRFGAKIELFSIPIFGWAIRRVGVLPIDREHRENVFKVYENARNRMLAGERFALSPEGTRQDEEKLGPFKSGPFIFAIQCQCPIVPVIVRNAHKVMSKKSKIPNWNYWHQTIYLEILDTIPTEGLGVPDKKNLMDKTREVMAGAMTPKLRE